MKRIILTIILVLFSLSAFGLEFGDYLKAAPVTAKIVLPLTMIPEMVTDGDSLISGVIGLGLFTLPNSFLLYNIITENPEGTKFWRTVTIYSDASVGLALAGSGIYLLAGGSFGAGDGWDQLVGALFVLMSAVVFGGVSIDTMPYSFE